ncbi:MAG: hypothetical protein FWF81_09865 [Defluviitaleaceae bacterium]|nr:hypothetical protein [Defluviitaleaceae bacterium]
MAKRNVLTAIGIVLSFAIAVGGWMITSWLIDMESDRLLSGTSSFIVDIPTIQSVHFLEEESEYPDIHPSLTESEIVSILRNWGLAENQRLHEPAPGQLDMEQAIMAGRAGLEFLYNQNIIPAEMLEFNSVRAYLGQNVPPGDAFLPLVYSYWNVNFSHENTHTNVTMNAVTGQIWGIETSFARRAPATILPAFGLPSLEINEMENILSEFLLNAGINSAGEFVQTTGQILIAPITPPEATVWIEYPTVTVFAFADRPLGRISFADGDANAVIMASGGVVAAETLHFTGLDIKLIANPWFAP